MFKFTDNDLHVFADTMRSLVQPTSSNALSLITYNKHRFLWKLPASFASRLQTLYPTFLSPSETHSRVRIESWIDYPHAVLQHPSVLAFVHHGGANSFIEAGWCGVPQVVLPQWADCYDTAAQVERLGLGVTTGEREAPYVSAVLFEQLLSTLLAATAASRSSVGELELLRGREEPAVKLRSYAWYKANAERFAAECMLAGGATRAAEIIESMYADELTEWDGFGFKEGEDAIP